MTDDEMRGYYNAYEKVAHKGMPKGSGVIATGLSGNPTVGRATEMAVDTALKHVPQEVKFGAALGAGMGAASAAKVLIVVGGVAAAPALATVAAGAAVVGAITAGAALVGKALGFFDE